MTDGDTNVTGTAAVPVGVLNAHLLAGLRISAATVALVVVAGLGLPAQLAADRLHPSSVIGIAALLAVSVVGVALALARRSWRRWRHPLATGCLLIASVDGLLLPDEALVTSEQQLTGIVGWLWVMLFIDVGMRPLAGYVGAHLTMTLVLLAQAGRIDAPTVVHFLLSAIAYIGFQLALGAAAGALRAVARDATAAAVRHSELRATETIAEQLHADRVLRYEGLRATVLPLLQSLTDGSACPADLHVQRRSALEAARLRRMFAEADDVPDPLRAELAAVIDVAERRGLVVAQAMVGAGPTPPVAERRLLLEEVAAILVRASGTARVTVAARPRKVTVSVVAHAADVTPGRRRVGPVAFDTVVEGGQVWTQASWTATPAS